MGKLGNFELKAANRLSADERNKRIADLRNLYWKNITDPHRHATGEGGHLFDPALRRFEAARVSYTEHFKPNAKTFRLGFVPVILPIIGFALLFKYEREGREKKFRNGEVSYRDRDFKFI